MTAAETFTHNGIAFTIARAPDFTGWIAEHAGAVIGKFPSFHVAKVACEFAALKLAA